VTSVSSEPPDGRDGGAEGSLTTCDIR
jgi:hypothetical protein